MPSSFSSKSIIVWEVIRLAMEQCVCCFGANDERGDGQELCVVVYNRSLEVGYNVWSLIRTTVC